MRVCLLLIAFIIFSCSPQKRLARLLKKYPQLSTIDTLVINDTIITKGVKIDTVFKFVKGTGPLDLKKGNLRMIYLHDTIYDSVYIDAECLPDTIIREIKTPSKTIFVEQTGWDSFKRYWWVFLIIAMLFFALILKK